MSTVQTRRRPSMAARRVGYLVAALVNLVGLWVLNVYPGWAALPFLTASTPRALGVVNASIALNLAVNVLFLVRDEAPVKALGDVVTTAVTLVALVRVWRVFPFSFGAFLFGHAEQLTRAVLVVSILGTAVAIVVNVVVLLRSLNHLIRDGERDG